jgi:hypothetical protein
MNVETYSKPLTNYQLSSATMLDDGNQRWFEDFSYLKVYQEIVSSSPP